MKPLVLVSFLLLIVSSCAEKEDQYRLAQFAVDEAIKVSGGDVYDAVHFEFDFRGRHYSSKRRDGDFQYKRITTDSTTETIDVYSSSAKFKRLINNTPVTISDSLAGRIESSINSVNYFVLLPFGLNDAAVQKTYLGKAEIKGEAYHKIQVTFSETDGGEDFEDVYIHWINTKTFKLEYLAYSFQVDGGGMRFREAYNERYLNGMRIVDYNNYKPKSEVDLKNLDALFEKGELELLSKIENENLKVNPLQ